MHRACSLCDEIRGVVGSTTIQERRRHLCRCPVATGDGVCVDIERCGRSGVVEPLGDGGDWNPRGQHLSGHETPEIIEAEALNSRRGGDEQ